MDYTIQSENFSAVIEQYKQELSTDIVDELVRIRKEKKMTQQDIADITGMKRPNIARIEGRKFTPTLDVLVRYAEGLGMKLHMELRQKE